MNQVLSLTADEIMLLTDRVSNGDVGVEPHGLSAYPLLLKLGSAYLDAFGDGTKRAGEIPIAVTEAEAWLLRARVSSADKSPSDALLGVKLLCKLYAALLAYNGAPSNLPSAEGDGQELTDADRSALKRWAEPYRSET